MVLSLMTHDACVVRMQGLIFSSCVWVWKVQLLLLCVKWNCHDHHPHHHQSMLIPSYDSLLFDDAVPLCVVVCSLRKRQLPLFFSLV